MRKQLRQIMILGLVLMAGLFTIQGFAQDDAPAPEPAAAAADAGGAGGLTAPAGEVKPASFIDVVKGGGPLGVILWIAILLTSMAAIALIVDAFITVREAKIMPATRVSRA